MFDRTFRIASISYVSFQCGHIPTRQNIDERVLTTDFQRIGSCKEIRTSQKGTSNDTELVHPLLPPVKYVLTDGP